MYVVGQSNCALTQVADKPRDMLANFKQRQEHSKLSACFSLIRNWQLSARIHLDSLKWNFARIHGFSPYLTLWKLKYLWESILILAILLTRIFVRMDSWIFVEFSDPCFRLSRACLYNWEALGQSNQMFLLLLWELDAPCSKTFYRPALPIWFMGYYTSDKKLDCFVGLSQN